MGQFRVLIVEDDPVFSALLRHTLAGQYSVQVAGSGEEALLAAIAQRPDLITMDHHMPGWDGLETMRRLQADPALASIPVIMCTSDTSTALLAEALTLGAKGFITKERFTPDAIREMVTDILSTHSCSSIAAN